jgi:hypothetical protein
MTQKQELQQLESMLREESLYQRQRVDRILRLKEKLGIPETKIDLSGTFYVGWIEKAEEHE